MKAGDEVASKNIKGITIEIGGNVQSLSKALESTNKQSRDLGSELKQVEKLLKLDPSNTVLLAQKQQLLSSQVETTADKLKTLKNVQSQIESQFQSGEIDEGKYRAFQREVEDTEIALKSAQKQLERFGNSAKNSAKDINAAKSDISEFGDSIKSGAAVAAKGLTALIGTFGALSTALVGVTASGAGYADNILTISTNTGLSTDYLEAYAYAAELVDVNLEAMTGSMAKNIKSMSSAQRGSEAYVEAYQKLGVSVTDSNGKLKDSETVYWSVIDALGKITDETDRDAISMQIFGRSAQELNSLIAIGSEGMAEYAKEAKAAGAVLGGDALDALGEFDDTLQRANSTTTAWKNQLAAKLSPSINKLTTQALNMGQKAIPKLEAAADKLVRRIDKIDMDDIAEDAEKVGKTLKTAAPLVVSLVSAFAGYKSITAATKAINVTRDAIKGLGVVMAANPATLYVTAAAAVVGLGVALYGLAKEADNTEETINRVFSRMDGINITAVADSFGEAADKTAQYARQVNELGDALDSSNESFNTASRSADYYMSKIAAAGEISEGDAEGIKQAFDDMTSSLESSLSSTSDIIYNSLVGALHSANADAKTEINGYIKSVYGVQAAVENELSQISSELDGYYEKILSGTITDADFSVMSELHSRMLALNGNISEVQTSWNMLRDDIANGNISLGSVEEVQSAVDGISEKATAALDDISAAETGAINAIENMVAMVGATETLTDAQKQSYIDSLTEMKGVTSAYYEEQKTLITEQQRVLAEAMASSVIEATNIAASEASPTFLEYFTASNFGGDAVSAAQARVREAGMDLLAPLEEILGSDRIAELGGSLPEGMAGGVNAKSGEAVSAVENMDSDMIQQVRSDFQTHSPSRIMHSIGVNITDGLILGMRSRKPALLSEARSLANIVKSTMTQALEINSPSRVMRKIGNFTGEGLALGLQDKIKDVEAASFRVVNSITAPASSSSVNNRSVSAVFNNTFQNTSPQDAQALVSEINRLLGDLL